MRDMNAIKKMSGSAMMMPYLASRLFNTPLLIHPKKLDAILAVVGNRVGLRMDVIPVMEDGMFPDLDEDDAAEPVQTGPVALIPVFGTLVKRGSWMNSVSGLTSYQGLRAKVDAAMRDDAVKALLFDFDSPGGEASGLFDLCNYLGNIRGTKPMIGISNDMAYSAAYALASCMDNLFVTGVGGTGSIGVYMLHVDMSEADKKDGFVYTYIHSGDKKVDMNPHEPLSKSALREAQEKVDTLRAMFVEQVATNRKVSAEAIYDTQAATYMGKAGVPLLANAVGTYDDALALAMTYAKASRSVALPRGGVKDGIVFKVDELYEKAKADKLFAAETVMEGDSIFAMRNYGSIKLEAGKDGSIGKVSGLLAPYNAMSCNLGGFCEIYQPGCFNEFIESNEDALVLSFHNCENVLGRRSNNTARFWEESDGLHYEADLPDTQAAKDLKVLVERGDVRGSSAAFYIIKHRWEQRSGGRVRVVEKATLVEGSPHSFVAYATTSAVTSEEQAATAHDELIGARLRLLKLKTEGAQLTI